MDEDNITEPYISMAHSRRALGYLGATLAEKGFLSEDFEQPQLLDFWGEALVATMDDDSPKEVK